MKKIFCGLLLIFSTSLFAQKDKMTQPGNRIGVLSPDSENEGSEKDKSFATFKLPSFTSQQTPGNNQVLLKNHANAQEIAEKAGKWLDNLEFTVALLPQHKYMINNCLGVKASVGEYKINVGMPFIRIDENGLLIRFQIDKLEDNKVTVRTRPCYKDGQCHFSPQLAIGGTMTDLRLDITLNPIMDLQTCKIVSLGMPHFKWRIGGANYKPLQNNLDEMIKNMMEDALTFATELIMPGRIAEAFNFIPMGGPNCGLPKVENSAEQQASSSNAASSGNEQWEMKTNAALKGNTGRIRFDCKDSVIIRMHFFNPGEQKHFDSWYKCETANFLPGSYDITVSGVRINNVPVQKGSDTRIRLGVLSVNVTGNMPWQVNDLSGKKVYNNYGSKKIALPVGEYKVMMKGRELGVRVEDGKVVEF